MKKPRIQTVGHKEVTVIIPEQEPASGLVEGIKLYEKTIKMVELGAYDAHITYEQKQLFLNRSKKMLARCREALARKTTN